MQRKTYRANSRKNPWRNTWKDKSKKKNKSDVDIIIENYHKNKGGTGEQDWDYPQQNV